MKILIYGLNFAPELTGIGKYSGEMAAWLSSRGHDVRVVTAPPYYPAWKVQTGYRATRYQVETWRGLRVLRCPLWVPANAGGLKRLVHLASFAASSIFGLLSNWRWKPDVVWLTEPPLFCAPAALGFARLRGAKAWLHIQDYEIDAAFDLGLLRGPSMRKAVTQGERWLMRNFDRVSTISERMMARSRDKGVDEARLVSFPNWVDVSKIQPLNGPSPYRAELGIPAGAVVALYSGNMGAKQGLEMLAETAAQLQGYPDVYFVFCGGGSGRADLVERCTGLANVQFLDLQPLERISDLLGLADIHLLPQRADAADLVMPSKLTGMLSSGRPVVAGARLDTELGKVAGECGISVPPDDAAAFAAAIASLASQPQRRQELGQRARAFAQAHLDANAILERFERDLERCISA
ncbi:MAG: colanic acid biosynthesis glycosyltransferase WcaI [Comamonadaceae bacterium]|nr:MAG: colanic acid biosynthesis glycosyltransferase WcaI [Comamonadaceae bacterium]